MGENDTAAADVLRAAAVKVGADLTGANLVGARYTAETRWPAGFDLSQSGASEVTL